LSGPASAATQDVLATVRITFGFVAVGLLATLAIERDTLVARCHAKDARLDEAEAELADLRGQAVVLRRLLADALAVLRTIEPEDTNETEQLEILCTAVARALQPQRKGALL